MDTHYEQTGARRIGATAAMAALPSTCSETPSETGDLPPRQKATRGHRQAIAELGLRFQPSNAAEMDAHRIRLELLALDCSEIAPALLRQACDNVAREAQFLPRAVELLNAARAIVEDRQRVQRSERTTHDSDGVIASDGDEVGALTAENVERCRAWNLRLIANQAPRRVVPLGAFNAYWVQVVDDGAIVPNHVCNGDGTVSHMLGGRK